MAKSLENAEAKVLTPPEAFFCERKGRAAVRWGNRKDSAVARAIEAKYMKTAGG